MLRALAAMLGRAIRALLRLVLVAAFLILALVLLIPIFGALLGLGIGPYFASRIEAIVVPPLRYLEPYAWTKNYVAGTALVAGFLLVGFVSTKVQEHNERARRAKPVAVNRRGVVTGWLLGGHAIMWILGTLAYFGGGSDAGPTPFLWILFNAGAVAAAYGHSRRRVWGHALALFFAVVWIAVAVALLRPVVSPVVGMALAGTPVEIIFARNDVGTLIYGTLAAAVHVAVAGSAARGILIAIARGRPSQPAPQAAPRRGLFRRLFVDTAKARPPLRPIVFTRVVGWLFCAELAVLGCGLAWHASQEFWWAETLGPLAAAASDPGRPGPSAESVRNLIRRYPDEPRLYYMLAGLHLAEGRELAAVTAMAAYREVSDASAVRAVTERLSLRYNRIESTTEYTLAGIDRRITATRQAIYALFQSAPAGSVALASRYSAGDLLRRSARAEAVAAVLNLDTFSATGIACLRPASCAPAFYGASPALAIRNARAEIRFPQGGQGCCMVSLRDPDLRLLSLPTTDSNAVRTPALRAQLLAVASRMLFKQMFLRNFVGNAIGASADGSD